MTYTPDAVIKIANEELGYLEKKSNYALDSKTENAGSNNWTKYWRDIYPAYQTEAWCLCFCVWLFEKAFGRDIAKKLLCMTNGYTFYTPTAASYFKQNNQWYTAPEVGDLIFFKNSQRIHHVGIVYKVDDKCVYTIEGNTSSGSEVIPNGGGVYAKQYAKTNTKIAGYGRPKYTKQEIVDIPITCGRAGLKIVGTDCLNVRKSPIDGKIVKTVNKNDMIQFTAKTKASDGYYWFKCADGYVKGTYLEGWIKESNEKWWYIQKGYTYPTLKVCEIDGAYYAFDWEGYMITSDRIAVSGEII